MKLKNILLQETTIEYWTEEPDNYDPWIAADQADQIAHKSGIRISRDKELLLIALNQNNDVIGAVWNSIDYNDEHPTYDFDVAVDPNHRTSTIGPQLITQTIQDYKTHQTEIENLHAKVYVINPKLIRVLEAKYGFQILSQYQNGTAHMILY